MRSWRVVSSLVGILFAFGPARALIPGGGGATRYDCLAEFGTTPANYPPDRPKEIHCTDNDPTCDQDPAVGTCGIAVSICLNVTDPALTDCIARPIESLDVKNFKPTSPKYDPALQQLEDEVTALLPLPETVHDRCTTDGGGAPVVVSIPLRLQGGTYRKVAKTIHPRLDATV